MQRIIRVIDWVKALDGMVLDALLATVAAIAAVLSVYGQPLDAGYKNPTFFAGVLAVASALPLFVRRLYPLSALIAACAVLTVHLLIGYPEGAIPIIILILTYSVGAWCPTKRAYAGLAVIYLVLLILMIADTPGLEPADAIGNVGFFTCAWVIGLVVRSRRAEVAARLAEAEERAEVQRQDAARAVAEERLRIAQELHDVVAHSMSVIAVQAGVGAHVLDTQPEEARRSLEAISHTSRSTLAEMRRLLGVLRGEDGEHAHVPAPGLGDLESLAGEVRVTGVDVALEVTGDPTTVPPGIDLSAYRVVQEALTNVIKHAGQGVSTRVVVGCSPDELRIEVADNGRGASVSSVNGGHGLMGMRERVTVWGGELAAGPKPGGGFRVTARIPFGDHE